ncbi:MAG: hypothetical protein KFF73_13990 [Cyclobacteriaceae bacterium]|nr:hypothetical protein [Cyclobacteriaceae bacterium]
MPNSTRSKQTFAGKLLETFNQGGINLMLSLGHRTGLFDSMKDLPPSTSKRIAGSAGLNERYVREWLNARASGNIIHYDAATQHYHLPAEHASFLTRESGADNIAVFAQYFSVLAQVEDKIISCFRNGGGVPYQEFSRFHEVMAEDSGQTVLSALFEHILPLVTGIEKKLEEGISVLDIGCGSAKALLMMAENYPKCRLQKCDCHTVVS